MPGPHGAMRSGSGGTEGSSRPTERGSKEIPGLILALGAGRK